MAKIIIEYRAKTKEYSDMEQVFLSTDIEKCWDQVYDFEDWLGRYYPGGYEEIYSRIILKETAW